MRLNLVVFKGRFILREATVELLRFHEKHYLRHRVILKGGRVDFFFLGNKISVTKRGYLTLYISVNIPSTVEQIEEIILAIGEAFLSFTCRLSQIEYRAANLHLSGKFPFKNSALFHRLKAEFQTLTNIIEITLCASDELFARFVDPQKLPVDGCTWSSLQLKVAEGKLSVLHRGAFTIITTKFQFIPFWEAFIAKHGDLTQKSV